MTLAVALVGLPAGAAPTVAGKAYDDAIRAFDKGDMQAAAVHLRNALQADNKMLAAHLLFGKVLAAMGEHKAAEAAFEEALRLGVSRSEVAPYLGPVYLQLGEARKVLDLVTTDSTLPGLKAQALTLRGSAFAMSGEVARAAEQFAQARREDPTSASPYIAEAPILLRTGEQEKALRSARKGTELASGNSYAWFQLGTIQHATGDLNGALDSLDKALALNPKHADSHVVRAMVLVALGRKGEAEKVLAFLKSEKVREPRASWLRGMLARLAGDEERAKLEFTDAINLLDPMPAALRNGTDPLLLAGALSHYHLGNGEKAREYLGILLGRNSKHLAAQLLQATIWVESGEYGKALPMLENLNRVLPDSSEVQHLLGRVYRARGQMKQAVDMLDKATRGGGGAALRDLSVTQLAMGQLQLGQANLEKAFAKNPQDALAGMELAVHYARTGQGQRAIQIAEQVLRRAPNDPSLLNFLGNVKGRLGDRKGQRVAYQTALEKSPDFRPVIFNMAWLDLDEGKVEAARSRVEAHLRRVPKDYEGWMQLGVIEQRAKRLEAALEHFQKAEGLQSRDPRPGLSAIDALLALRQPAAAATAAKTLSAKFPNDLGVQLSAARALLAAGNQSMARATLQESSKLAGYDVAGLVEVARLQLRGGILDGAAHSVNKALQSSPEDVSALLLNVEVTAAGQGSPADVDKAMAALVAKHPSHPGTLATAGHIAMSRGQFAKAANHYRSAFEKAPGTQGAVLLTQALLANGEEGKALAHLESWAKRNPNDPLAKRALADTQVAAGKPQLAKAAYSELLAADPGNEDLQVAYVRVLRKLKDPQALAVAERAFKTAPRNPNLADALGWLLVESGNSEAGIRVLREARLRDPAHAPVRWHLAAALARAGLVSEAREEVRAAVAANLSVPADVDAKALKASLGL